MEKTNFPRESTMREIANALNMIAVAQAGQATNIESWDAVKQLVRQGVGPAAFPIGAQLRVEHTTLGEIIWDVVAHDYDKNPNDPEGHTMTLLAHKCVHTGLQYDREEALYVATTGLQPGTYHFTLLADYDTTYGGGKSYQFTLTKAVPANGVVCFPWAWNTQANTTKISTYTTVGDTGAAIESVAVTEGTGGTDLGTADGTGENMNHTHRIRYGSNNWRESAMRQWLNSKAAAGSVWKSQTKFDRPPTWATTTAGFMNGLPEDFLAVVGECDHVTKTNTVYEVDGVKNTTYTTRDKFFLPSHSEVFGGSESGLTDGTQYPYYKGATNEDRIKVNTSDVARYWWLRSPNPGHAGTVRFVDPDGTLGSGDAHYAHAVAAACVIY